MITGQSGKQNIIHICTVQFVSISQFLQCFSRIINFKGHFGKQSHGFQFLILLLWAYQFTIGLCSGLASNRAHAIDYLHQSQWWPWPQKTWSACKPQWVPLEHLPQGESATTTQSSQSGTLLNQWYRTARTFHWAQLWIGVLSSYDT